MGNLVGHGCGVVAYPNHGTRLIKLIRAVEKQLRADYTTHKLAFAWRKRWSVPQLGLVSHWCRAGIRVVQTVPLPNLTRRGFAQCKSCRVSHTLLSWCHHRSSPTTKLPRVPTKLRIRWRVTNNHMIRAVQTWVRAQTKVCLSLMSHLY